VLVIGLLLQAVLVVVLSTILMETLVAWSFRYPRWSPIPISLLQYLHIRFDRNVIQVMPECAIYDARVTYTLKPGTCIFASREFRNEYRINSLGLRDDEQSLQMPHTVMLGDSLTMGWGVDQDETFAQQYEARTGRRTLNAGVSSFGTVRELRFLERIDRSALRNVVLQYNENDAVENLQFVEHPDSPTLTLEQYRQTVADQAQLLRYVPGKYTFNIAVQLQSMLRRTAGLGREQSAIDIERQADVFAAVVERSAVDLSTFRTVVLSVNPRFLEALRKVAADSRVPAVRQLEFVDASSTEQLPGGHYTLDDHPTAVGQEAIAKLLIKHLEEGD
jgi:lysophospholipase L1-like esterase